MKAKNVVPLRQPKQPPPAPPADAWPIVVRLLHGPARNKRGEEVHQLEFRQPFARDIKKHGNPVRINYDGDILFDEPKMTSMIAALSGLHVSSIERLDPRDWNSCAFRLRGFFLPDPAAW
jgi:hypothetical protein